MKKMRQGILLLLTAFLYCTSVFGQLSDTERLIAPIYGKLMLIGTDELSNRTAATFAYLAGEQDGKLVIITDSKKSKKNIQFNSLIGDVSTIYINASEKQLDAESLNKLREATAVWLAEDVTNSINGSQLIDELQALLKREGTIGAQGIAAESMGAIIRDGEQLRDGLNLLPNGCVCTSNLSKFEDVMKKLPGRVGWEIPSQASIVIHNGRQISVIGDDDITLRTPANGTWEERVESFGPPIDELPYTTDLISWNRSAVARQGELFPPAVAPTPEVSKGALMIIGGHGYPEGMWEKVIDFAGGTDAKYVCFSQTASSTGARKLRERGCTNIALHVVKTGIDGIGQCNDKQLLEDLKDADAVYFGGGRSYKFMDAYLGTEAHELMNKVLERGGIILGGSAGAQIQGDFLVRGDPRTNNTTWMEGNDVGLGFLKGVIIDVHFRERGREDILPSLLVQHPQMLGIGIDETTALFVQGTTAEVLGPHAVTFYDLKGIKNIDPSSENIGNPVILLKGEKYDLKHRSKINN